MLVTVISYPLKYLNLDRTPGLDSPWNRTPRPAINTLRVIVVLAIPLFRFGMEKERGKSWDFQRKAKKSGVIFALKQLSCLSLAVSSLVCGLLQPYSNSQTGHSNLSRGIQSSLEGIKLRQVDLYLLSLFHTCTLYSSLLRIF